MKRSANSAAYISKAERALRSAHAMLRDLDAEGACNRAYYAMFNAARAALLVAGVGAPDEGYKTHGGLIAAFGKHLVTSGQVEAALGRAINQVQRLRQIADYVGDPPSLDDATWAVAQADAFVAAMRARVC
ncbi:HEPN domain-containing protein [Rhodopila globiformis]|uniref:HEPN domain-containing protein n=1 Tax=Rhodopila globiformis TaxID=1071 RepID=A0A2S6MUM7_RHOGL|nr:HEPN domain-containing protein [Rhodopila globiformis]PPQ26064.1 hypothetical protein CCS01_31090 [Rhodopila globiformis]